MWSMRSESAAGRSLVKPLETLVTLCLSTSCPKVKTQLSDTLTMNACVVDDVSMFVSFHRVTLSSCGLAHIWNSVCGGHSAAGGHFTAGKVHPFSSSPL